MNRTIFWVLLFIIFSQNMFSQALFAWCPEDQIISPRNGFLENKNIDLYIYDSRTSTEKALVNCSGERIRKNLIRLIKETYTSADINIIPVRNSSVESQVNRITINIGIGEYHVGLDTGMDHQTQNDNKTSVAHGVKEENWKAVVGYSLEVIDFTKGKKSKLTKAISKNTITPKTEDFEIAKDILTTTFDQANRELLIFIEDAFIYEDAY